MSDSKVNSSSQQLLSEFLNNSKGILQSLILNTDTGKFMLLSETRDTIKSMKPAVLDYHLRPGDIVLMNAEKDNQSDLVSNGTVGVVTGHSVFERAVSYNQLLLYGDKTEDGTGKPGIYQRKGSVEIYWLNGVTTKGRAGDIVNLTDNRFSDRDGFEEFRRELEKEVYLRPLPDLPIWPGDVVELNQPFFFFTDEDSSPSLAFVSTVDYDDINEKRTDGSQYPLYTIRGVTGMTGSTCVNEYIDAFQKHSAAGLSEEEIRKAVGEDIFITRVAERGNIWAWFNDRSKLKFESIDDELQLYKNVGLTEQVQSPSGSFNWKSSEILQGLVQGTICFCCETTTRRGSFQGWTIPNNPEIKKRVLKLYKDRLQF